MDARMLVSFAYTFKRNNNFYSDTFVISCNAYTLILLKAVNFFIFSSNSEFNIIFY